MLEKKYMKHTEKLLSQADRYTTGPYTVRQLKIIEGDIKFEKAKELLKANIPFVKGKVTVDHMVFHDFPTAIGMMHIVTRYWGKSIIPLDALMVCSGKIPQSAYLDNFGIWGTRTGTEGTLRTKREDFPAFLSKYKLKRQKFHSKFNLLDQTVGTVKIKIPWFIQIMPLSPEKYLFSIRYIGNYLQSITKKASVRFVFETFLEKCKMMKDAIQEYNYQGEVIIGDLLGETQSVPAIPEISGYLGEIALGSEANIPPQKKETELKKEDPLEIAKRRLAAGEITVEEYEKIKIALA